MECPVSSTTSLDTERRKKKGKLLVLLLLSRVVRGLEIGVSVRERELTREDVGVGRLS